MALPVYKRQKDGLQYTFGGLRTLKNADAFQPNKYPLATNIRSRTGNSIRTRPGLTFLFATGVGATAVTDLRAYAALATDNRPRFLARDSLDRIWLDTGAQVGSLLAGGLGVSLIPFRPAQSPNPFMYVANAADYQKFSAPDGTGSVIQHEVGITEPQSSPDAAIDTFSVDDVTGVASGWAAAGTAGAISDITRITDTVGAAVLADPASVPPSLGTRYSVQTGAATQYQIGMRVDIGALPIRCVVEDIFPSISTGVSLSILSIFYFTGATGRCVIVPNLMPVDNSIPAFSEGDPTGGTIGMQQLIASLRRGSIIKLNLESVLVLSVSRGPSGSIAIETSTVSSHAAGETLSGVPAIAVHSGVAPTTGMVIAGSAIQWSNAVGLGTVTTPFTSATNPFIHLNSGDPTLPAPQQEDYVHLSINVSDLTQLSTTAPAIRIMFDVNSGAADFAANYFYFEVRANDLLAAVSGTQSQLAGAQTAAQRQGIDRSLDAGGALDSVDISPTFGTRNPAGSRQLPAAVTGTTAINTSGQTELGSSQWSEVLFPIQSLTRVGNDSTRTLANCQAVRVQLNTLGTTVIQIGSLWVGQGGGQPDVGDVGALYFYRVRPRDSRTGVVGNPSPSTRYGVNPRRQRVILSLPSAAYDSQIDTWDIFRYGGSVAAFRYIGSVASTATTYTDNVFDDAARAGDPLDFDNFEPWPSVDLPFTGTAQLVVGTIALVTIPAGFSPLRWLPGTQIILSGTQAFTLRARPTLVSGTTYLLQFIENAGTGTAIPAQINEPLLANQPGAYLWGPDSVGTIFSCGDALRPSTVSYSKQFIPDSAPDSYNQELCPPSEPLLGGDIVDGVSIVASSSRWWRLIPQFNLPQRYSAVPLPWPRGLAAPFGHCVARGTLIDTKRGLIPIEEVTTNDYALTRKGWRRILFSGQTGVKPVIKLGPLQITEDHKILVNDEFISVRDMMRQCQKGSNAESFLCVRRSSYLTALSIADTRNLETYQIESILRDGEIAEKPIYTSLYGNKRMGLYQRAKKSITKTTTSLIMTLETLRLSLLESIADIIDLLDFFPKKSLVCTAGSYLQFHSLPHPYTKEENVVHFPVLHGFVSPCLSEPVPVYDLEVEDAHEFFADGILVHNCTDGEQEYWWAKDGISGSTSGSLTDLDLYNLFPHEGVAGENVTYAGTTYFAPDYARAGTFRLTYCDGFLYADYQDSTGTPRTLTLNLRRPLTSIMVAPPTPAWCVDQYATPVTCHYAIEQQAGSVLTTGTRYAILVMGNSAGIVGQQSDLTNDLGVPIPCVISTSEFGGGDVRTNDLYGDIFLDSLPNAPAGIMATPTLFGAPSGPSQVIPSASVRTQVPVSLGGGVIQSYLGLRCAWTDDFSVQAQPTELFIWQPSAIDKPEPIVDRFTDWDDAGTPMAKFVQGFILEADTLGANVNLLVRNGDSLLPMQTFVVNHATQQEKAYSFTTPFIAHLMRIEPQGTPSQWRLFEVKWIFQPTPESALVWTTQATSHGLRGFQHVRQVSVSYRSTATVTLTITAFDGTSPAAITLPNTGGAVQKVTFPLTFNKGMQYTYSFTSAAPFAVYEDDLEVVVGAWGRTDQYTNYPLVGGKRGDGAEV